MLAHARIEVARIPRAAAAGECSPATSANLSRPPTRTRPSRKAPHRCSLATAQVPMTLLKHPHAASPQQDPPMMPFKTLTPSLVIIALLAAC